MNTDVTLVYLLGGISQRFGGGIKALAPVGPHQEPLLEISLQQALPASFTKIVFIVSPATQAAFNNRFGYSYHGIPILYALQTHDSAKRNRPWGTAEALHVALPLLGDDSFVICNGDDLYGASSFAQAKQALISSSDHLVMGYLLGSVLTPQGSVNRGIILTDKENKMQGMREELGLTRENLAERGLSPDTLCSMNLFGIQPSLLPFLREYVLRFLEMHAEDRTSECLLPEFVNESIRGGKARFNVRKTSDPWMGITYASDIESIRAKLRN